MTCNMNQSIQRSSSPAFQMPRLELRRPNSLIPLNRRLLLSAMFYKWDKHPCDTHRKKRIQTTIYRYKRCGSGAYREGHGDDPRFEMVKGR
mmetsp:Transcript_9260/g.10742  ORF Transcript_9260/g.10742 Transcript_9260/m.10742 type:complete len:91 (+) Transcript_9260:86-358(+)